MLISKISITQLKLFLVFFLSILVATFIAILFTQKIKIRPHSPNIDAELKAIQSNYKEVFLGIREKLLPIVRKFGIDGAFLIIEKALTQKLIDMDECHMLLHQLGHKAYTYLNKDFAKLTTYDSLYCVQSFQHGVEAQIVLDNDAVVAQNLQKYCSVLKEKNPGITCYHGAGHGLLQIKGNLSGALKGCDDFGSNIDTIPIYCYRGVFSEYASRAMGYDTDTGKLVEGELPWKVDPQNPFLLCQTLEKKYQISCVSQFTKLVYKRKDMNSSILRCVSKELPDWIMGECLKTIAGMDAQWQLVQSDQVILPLKILSLGKDLRQKYIEGVKEGFWTFKKSGINKDWQFFCNSFTSGADVSFCHEFYHDL